MCKKDSFVIIEGKIGKIEKKIIDKYNAVYWTVFLIGKFGWISCDKLEVASYHFPGVLCMLPWDMLVTVNGYWHYKFRNTTLDDVVLPENEALRTLLTPPGIKLLMMNLESGVTWNPDPSRSDQDAEGVRVVHLYRVEHPLHGDRRDPRLRRQPLQRPRSLRPLPRRHHRHLLRRHRAVQSINGPIDLITIHH